jgi:hypothetical protein
MQNDCPRRSVVVNGHAEKRTWVRPDLPHADPTKTTYTQPKGRKFFGSEEDTPEEQGETERFPLPRL